MSLTSHPKRVLGRSPQSKYDFEGAAAAGTSCSSPTKPLCSGHTSKGAGELLFGWFGVSPSFMLLCGSDKALHSPLLLLPGGIQPAGAPQTPYLLPATGGGGGRG